MAFYIELEHTLSEIVTLQEFKAQLKEVEPTLSHPEDALFQGYVDAAVEECEGYINRAIIVRKYKVLGKSFSEVIKNSLHTLQAIDSIEYKDVSGNLQTLEAAAYSIERVDKFENKVVFRENFKLPEVQAYKPDAVQLFITVGFEPLPKKIKQAVLLKAVAMDQMRGDYVKNKTTASERLLQSLKKY
tara:strand:- start:616 stop:1176 length:561 start_codon:yes stop_codon:yes gene_type:complete